MLNGSVCVQTLQRALEEAKSERRLARWLQVPTVELRAWLAGKDIPPVAVFLAAVDIIENSATQKRLVDARPASEELPQV
jgi:hypothetical protein